MTENKKTKEPSEVTNDDIAKFLETKAKVHQCPVCLSGSWAIVNDPNHNLGLMALPKDGSFRMPPASIPVAAVACETCGYLRLHAMGLIANFGG